MTHCENHTCPDLPCEDHTCPDLPCDHTCPDLPRGDLHLGPWEGPRCPSVWSESPLSRRPRWWDRRGRIAPASTHEKGPPAILSQDPGCQRPVLAVGSSSSRGGPARVLTPCSRPHPIVPVPGPETAPSAQRAWVCAHPCNQLHVGPRTFKRHQQAPGWRGPGGSGQRAATAGLQSEGHPPVPGLPGPKRQAPGGRHFRQGFGQGREFIRSALNRLWARGPGRMPGTRDWRVCFPAPPPAPRASAPSQTRWAGAGRRTRPPCGQHVP